MILGVRGTIPDAEGRTFLPRLVKLLRENRFRFLFARELLDRIGGPDPQLETCPAAELAQRTDVVMTLGGDGSILAAARELTRDVPIFGLHMGTFGYLTAAVPENLAQMLERLRRGDYHEEERMRLLARVENGREDLELLALNELVVTTNDPAHIVTIETRINKEHLFTFNGDGLIVSSPTGSTAYSLAANGPVLEPTMRAMIINPINPHTIAVRPLVVSHRSRVEVILRQPGKVFLVSADGQHDCYIRGNGRVVITEAQRPIHLIKFDVPGFLGVLREKLKWNIK